MAEVVIDVAKQSTLESVVNSTRVAVTPTTSENTHTFALVASKTNVCDFSSLGASDTAILSLPSVPSGVESTSAVLRIGATAPSVIFSQNVVFADGVLPTFWRQANDAVIEFRAFADLWVATKIVYSPRKGVSAWANMNLASISALMNKDLYENKYYQFANRASSTEIQVAENTNIITLTFDSPTWDLNAESHSSIPTGIGSNLNAITTTDTRVICSGSGSTIYLGITKTQGAIGSGAFNSTFSIEQPTGDVPANCATFSSDGMKFFWKTYSNSVLQSVDLDAPFAIEAFRSYKVQATKKSMDFQSLYNGAYSVPETGWKGYSFAPDGSAIVVALAFYGTPGVSAVKYNLSQPWDLSSATYDSEGIVTSDTSILPTAFVINEAGNRLLYFDYESHKRWYLCSIGQFST